MQVCTQACGNVASIASGKPFSPSTDHHVLDAAPAQVLEDRQPELGALGFLPHAQHLALAVDGNPEREVAGEVAHIEVSAVERPRLRRDSADAKRWHRMSLSPDLSSEARRRVIAENVRRSPEAAAGCAG